MEGGQIPPQWRDQGSAVEIARRRGWGEDFLQGQFLKEGEEMIHVVRRWWALYVFPLGFSVALVCGVFFVLIPFLDKGRWGTVIWILMLSGALWYFVRMATIAFYNAFLITDQRIIDIDQKGLFSRTVSEAPFGRIQDISYSQRGVFETLFRLGTVRVQTAGKENVLEMERVRHPDRIQRLIAELQHEHMGGQQQREEWDTFSRKELVALLKKIQYAVGEDEFLRLVQEIKGQQQGEKKDFFLVKDIS